MSNCKDNINSECPDCGGDVKTEIVGSFRDWVCQDCGLIVAGGEVVENQENSCDCECGDTEIME